MRELPTEPNDIKLPNYNLMAVGVVMIVAFIVLLIMSVNSLSPRPAVATAAMPVAQEPLSIAPAAAPIVLP